jgi:hypothetical protein
MICCRLKNHRVLLLLADDVKDVHAFMIVYLIQSTQAELVHVINLNEL